MPREMREAVVELPNGLSTHYYEWPGSGPKLVFLHPSAGYGRMWEWTVDALGDRFHVFAADQRGHGFSGRPEGDYSAEEYADDVALFMDAVGIERAVIVGHSLGGRVAQVFAGRYPERIEGMVLVASPHLSNFHATREAARAVLANAADTLGHPEEFASVDEALAFMKARWPWSPESDGSLRHRIAYNFEHRDGGRVAPRYDNIRVAQGLAHLTANLRPYAARAECPVMILLAKKGSLTREQAEELARYWRDARIVEIDGTYALQMDNPQALAGAIADFAATVGAG